MKNIILVAAIVLFSIVMSSCTKDAIVDGGGTSPVTPPTTSADTTQESFPTQTGFYLLSGEELFTVKSKASNTERIVFMENYTPKQGKKIEVSLIETPVLGAKIQITVKPSSVELQGLEGNQLSVEVKKVTESLIIVKSDKYVVVLPKKQ